MSFPIYIRLGNLRIHPHPFFEAVAYLVGFLLFWSIRRRDGDPFSDDFRWWVISAASVGAAVGCRLLAWLEAPDLKWQIAGKTVVGGLAGGLLAVEIVKKRLGANSAAGDLFAIPLVIGIAIGRIGCFLSGLADDTYGSATNLPWGIDFGDGVARHPTQLYEIIFLAGLGAFLLAWQRRPHMQGDIFKLFMIGYMGWRFLIDFLKPAKRAEGISAIQLACLLVLVYYAPHIPRIAKAVTGRKVLAES